jgi:hypothetical protein
LALEKNRGEPITGHHHTNPGDERIHDKKIIARKAFDTAWHVQNCPFQAAKSGHAFYSRRRASMPFCKTLRISGKKLGFLVAYRK